MATALSKEALKRYERQIKLPGFGLEGQLRLLSKKILLVGGGGLGCPLALYLAAGGVGEIAVLDSDKVELSNLQRQIAFKTSDIGKNKADALAKAMSELNPQINVRAIDSRLTADNYELLRGYDLVIDGTDNFESRFLIADSAYLLGLPVLHGAVYQSSAQVFLNCAGTNKENPCYRCLFAAPPKQGLLACSEVGVLGVIAGAAAMLMAGEAVKFLSGSGKAGELICYDGASQSIKKLALAKDNACPLCALGKITKPESSASTCRDLKDLPTISARAAKARHAEGAILIDVREAEEYEKQRLTNSINLPLSTITEANTETGLPSGDLLIYCQKGRRSIRAAHILHDRGVRCVSVDGGIEALIEVGFPLITLEKA